MILIAPIRHVQSSNSAFGLAIAQAQGNRGQWKHDGSETRCMIWESSTREPACSSQGGMMVGLNKELTQQFSSESWSEQDSWNALGTISPASLRQNPFGVPRAQSGVETWPDLPRCMNITRSMAPTWYVRALLGIAAHRWNEKCDWEWRRLNQVSLASYDARLFANYVV